MACLPEFSWHPQLPFLSQPPLSEALLSLSCSDVAIGSHPTTSCYYLTWCGMSFPLSALLWRESYLQPSRVMISTACTELLSLLLQKLLICGVFFKIFSLRTPPLVKKFSTGLKYDSFFCRRPFSRIPAFTSQLFKLPFASESEERMLLKTRDVIERDIVLPAESSYQVTTPRSETSLSCSK